ncbi:unnamed protein product [Rotaria sordida]|uniref:Uncharacterized protein n=1 Tax=Rotaria sordida TaxID=392033 RepID=A0A814TQN5_9BILA|nr:unnamed protein product [Rotaria sordida]
MDDLFVDCRAIQDHIPSFLLTSTGQCRLVIIEIDVGDSKNGIEKIIKFICEIKSDEPLENLIQSLDNYLYYHRSNNILLNNCRTFVEYLIDKKGIRRKTRINIIGHSLGGTLPRFSLRFWPDIRSMVNHLIAFGPTNRETIMADAACSVVPCPIAVIQQRINSSFLYALNSYKETFPPIKYTNILSKFDELVRPLNSSEINAQCVKNISIQDICRLRIFAEHLAAGIYDYCGYILTMNALNSQSFKNISSDKCCSKILMPGINLTKTEFISKVIYSSEEHARHLLYILVK